MPVFCSNWSVAHFSSVPYPCQFSTLISFDWARADELHAEQAKAAARAATAVRRLTFSVNIDLSLSNVPQQHSGGAEERQLLAPVTVRRAKSRLRAKWGPMRRRRIWPWRGRRRPTRSERPRLAQSPEIRRRRGRH